MNTINDIKKNLSVLILCGGKGLRLRPLTRHLPKPLIEVRNKSILEHIISHFLKFNIDSFIIASGYKHKLINTFIKKKFKDLKIKVLNTGINSDIIKRIDKSKKHSRKYLLVCYGDTIIDINLNKYLNFYLSKPKKITVASYQLESSFGIFSINKKNLVTNFKEKPLMDIWFNVGYLLFSPENLKYLKKFRKFEDLITFLSKKNLMKTFKHNGNHITINTLTELEKARRISGKFFK